MRSVASLRGGSVPGCTTRSNTDGATITHMTRTITIRPDDATEKALAALTRDGSSVSAVVRSALLEAARRRADESLRAEAQALADDPHDVAEAAQVLNDMETLRAW